LNDIAVTVAAPAVNNCEPNRLPENAIIETAHRARGVSMYWKTRCLIRNCRHAGKPLDRSLPVKPVAWIRNLAGFAVVAVVSGCATTPPPSQALSSSAVLRPTSDKTKPYAYRRPDANFAAYNRVIVPPTEIYAGLDAQFGKMSSADRQALASYMHQEFVKVLGRRFQIVGQPGPDTLRARLTLTGAETSTPVLSTVTHVLPVGLIVNAGAQATGGRGTFSGWMSYAVEIEDAPTGSLLYAHVATRSANALDITANFGSLDAAKAGVRSAANHLGKELAGSPR